ncbi:S26 family signal peptidase [Dactylosporangium sp. NPDC050588]|uniref:S26 family signal peptidase n=1 Tax=Dactylosporangium sp. NPDC050588 TaxID=3157211 RepID=UPI003404F5D5
MTAVLGAAAAVAMVIAVVAILGRVRNRLLLVTVTGDSMAPDLNKGDVVLVRRSRRCRPGDIALLRLKADGVAMVKRVVAVAGDPVPGDMRVAVPQPVVPADAVLVLGTRPDSMDSRRLGPIPVERVVGVVVRTMRRQSTRAPDVTR